MGFIKTAKLSFAILLVCSLQKAFAEGSMPPAPVVTADPEIEAKDGALRARHKQRLEAAKQRTASAKPGQPAVPATGSKVQMTEQKLVASLESCETARSAAKAACAEWLSPEIASFVKDYGMLMSVAMGAASGLADQCKGIGDLLNKGSIALGAYQTACGVAQGICNSKCNTALSNLGYVQTENKAAVGEANTTLSTASLTQNAELAAAAKAAISHYGDQAEVYLGEEKNHIVQKVEFCQKFQIGIASATIGVVNSLRGVAQAKQCEEKNSVTGGIDCSDPKNGSYNSKACMCTRNELPAAECQGMAVALNGGVKAPPIAAGNRTGATIDGDGNPISGSDGTSFGASGEVGGLAGGAGAPVGSGGSGAAGGGVGGSAQDGVSGTRRMNTNVLGGFGGGGGGAWTSAPGYGEVDAKLLAQAKEKSRSVASQAAAQITGQAGRSNWEKVKSRYIDNANRLLRGPK